jgi:hypothetical protein
MGKNLNKYNSNISYLIIIFNLIINYNFKLISHIVNWGEEKL